MLFFWFIVEMTASVKSIAGICVSNSIRQCVNTRHIIANMLFFLCLNIIYNIPQVIIIEPSVPTSAYVST